MGRNFDPDAILGKNRAAAIAGRKRKSFLDRKKRDKEEAQVGVDPFPKDLMAAANRTPSRLLVQHLGFGLNPSDKEKHL